MSKHSCTIILIFFATFSSACGTAPTAAPSATSVAISTATITPPPLPSSTPEEPTIEPPGVSWLQSYGDASNNLANVVLPAGDGGYYLTGATDLQAEPDPQGDVHLIRTDLNGEILWESTYGGAEYESAAAMIQANDGNLVIAGGTRSSGAGEVDIYMLKVDPEGNELWSRTFGSIQDEEAVSVSQTQDGGYILFGYTRIAGSEGDIDAPGNIGAGESYIYLVKTDGEGNELWTHVYSGDNDAQVYTSAGLPTSDGGFLVLARINPTADHNTFLLKVDSNGNEIWSRAWETGNLRAGNDIIPTSDGNYLIAGISESPDGRCSILLIKVDPEGNEIWVNVIDDNTFKTASTAIEVPDGGFVVIGFTATDTRAGAMIIKVDEHGQPIWMEDFIDQRLFHANSILLPPDGGYIIAGETDTGRGVADAFLLKLDAEH